MFRDETNEEEDANTPDLPNVAVEIVLNDDVSSGRILHDELLDEVEPVDVMNVEKCDAKRMSTKAKMVRLQTVLTSNCRRRRRV